MMKFYVRIICVALVICSSSMVAKAQLGYNYAQYDAGFGVGVNSVYGDIQTVKTSPSVNFNFTYNQTPFINYLFDMQIGRLQGGDSVKDKYGREFTSNFVAFDLRGQVQLGEVIDYSRSQFANALKNFYLSAGVGYLVNNITGINRYSINLIGYYTPGANNINAFFIPIKIGYEFKLFNQYNEPSVKIDLGYSFNPVLSDNLDGFTAGKYNDIYTQFSIGFKFAIGGETSYGKQIAY